MTTTAPPIDQMTRKTLADAKAGGLDAALAGVRQIARGANRGGAQQ